MAMPKGSITCLLCKGAISVRSGNLDKFKVHVENDHDVFYDHDILIAINFLEAHEKEAIIEKVLPRMRLLFDNVRSFNGKISIGDKLALEKRLLENDENETDPSILPAMKKARYSVTDDEIHEVDTSEMDSYIQSRDRGEEINIGDDSDDEDQLVQKINYDIEEDNGAVSVGETLAESIESIRDILRDKKDNQNENEFADCDLCHQSIRKSIFDFHRKSPLSAAKTTAECDICRKVMQKKSMYKHKRRCHILNNINRSNTIDDTTNKDASVNVSEHEVESPNDGTKSAEVDVPMPSTNDGESHCYICKKPMLKGNIRRHIRMVHTSEMDFKCKICFTGFQKLESLKWHTTKEHNLDLEDVEQMLQESNEELSKDAEKQCTNSSDNPKGSVNLDPQILEKIMKTEHDEPSDKTEEGDTKKYKCEQCDNEYTNKDSVRRHRRKAHPQFVGHPSI